MRAAWMLPLLLLVPAASACSLTSDPPGPGLYWVHDATGALRHTIEVHERNLGGDCSLDNDIGLGTRHFAWHDQGAASRIDLATGEVLRLELPARGPHTAFTHRTYVDAGFLDHTSMFEDNASRGTWTLHRLDGTTATLPLPGLWAHLAWTDGANVLVQNRSAARAPVTTRLFDVATGAMVAGPLPLATLAAGPDWHVTQDNGTYTRQWTGHPPATLEPGYPSQFGWGMRFDRDGVWSTSHDDEDDPRLLRHDWSGALLVNASARGEMVASSAAYVVLGDYSPFGPGAPTPTIGGPALALLAAPLAARLRRGRA